jgi:hypothetical protein
MKIFSLLFLTTVLSCGDDRFTKVETLEGFRIIGINATNPEVAPGGNSTLSVYVSDVTGGGRPINGTYERCIDPGISLGAEVKCDHDPSAFSAAYNINTAALNPADSFFTGYAGALPVTVPASILVGRSAREQFNGVGYIVIFRFTVDGKNVSAFKRIVATNRGSLNQNPSGADVLLNGAIIASNPKKDDRLTVTNLIPETYSYQNVDGSTETRMEDLEVGWFVSAGSFDRPKSDYGETVKFLDDAPASLLLVAVVRDDRGGMEVVRYPP